MVPLNLAGCHALAGGVAVEVQKSAGKRWASPQTPSMPPVCSITRGGGSHGHGSSSSCSCWWWWCC